MSLEQIIKFVQTGSLGLRGALVQVAALKQKEKAEEAERKAREEREKEALEAAAISRGVNEFARRLLTIAYGYEGFKDEADVVVPCTWTKSRNPGEDTRMFERLIKAIGEWLTANGMEFRFSQSFDTDNWICYVKLSYRPVENSYIPKGWAEDSKRIAEDFDHI